MAAGAVKADVDTADINTADRLSKAPSNSISIIDCIIEQAKAGKYVLAFDI